MADEQTGASADYIKSTLERIRKQRGGDVPTATPPPGAPERPKGSFLTRSVLGRDNIQRVADSTGNAINAFNKVMPAFMRNSKSGQFVTEMVQDLVREGGPEMLDFATSPEGLTLIGAHFFPVTAPLAYGADVLLSGGAAMQGVADAASLWKDPTPRNASRLIMDVIAAKGLKDIGKSGIRRSIPEERGTEFTSNVRRAATEAQDHPDKIAAVESARRNSPGETRLERLHDNPLTGPLARMANVPLPGTKAVARDIVQERNSIKMGMDWVSKSNEYNFRREVPTPERDISKIGAVIEGDKTAQQVGLTEQANKWVGKLRDHRRRMDQMMREAYGEDIPLADAENYLTHFWDFGGDAGATRRAAKALIRDPFLKKRKIATYQQGIEYFADQGIEAKPRYTDVADIERARDEFAATASANFHMAKSLREMGVLLSEQDHDALKLDWKRAEGSHALDRATYTGTERKTGIDRETGEPVKKEIVHETYKPVYVHPDFLPAVETIFKSDNPGQLIKAFDTIRAAEKKMRLNFSFFHANSLTEQGHATDILRGWRDKTGKPVPGDVAKRLTRDISVFNPDFYKGIRTGLWRIAEREGDSAYQKAVRAVGHTIGKDFTPPVLRLKFEEVEPWIKGNLQLRPSAESESQIVSMIRDRANMAFPNTLMQKIGTVAAKGLQPLADAMQVWDTGLWEFYHQGMMLNAAETIFTDEMNNAARAGREIKPEQEAQLRKDISEHVNNAFGAINHQNLMLTPQWNRVMNFALLAPAWTLSNLRVLMSAYESEAGLKLASHWAKGAVASYFITTQLLNYALTSYYQMPDKDGKKGGHFSWDNSGAPINAAGKRIRMSENAVNVAAGWNYDDKGNKTTERYIKPGRAYREPFLWMADPWGMLGSKIGQLPRTVMTAITGHGPGGYEEINTSGRFFGHQNPPGHRTAQTAAMVASQVTPMAVDAVRKRALHYLFPDTFAKSTPSAQVAGLPTSAGITMTRAVEAWLSAYKDGDNEAIAEILKTAATNNIDPEKVVRSAYQDLMAEMKSKQR